MASKGSIQCIYLICMIAVFGSKAFLYAKSHDQVQPQSVGISILSVDLSSDDRDVANHAKQVITEQLRDVFHANGHYHWVERADQKMLERILSELKFQNSGLVASDEVKNLGNLAGIGVFVVVSGDLSVGMFGCDLALKVRLIDVESSKLISIYDIKSKGKFRIDPNKSAEDAISKAMKDLALKM